MRSLNFVMVLLLLLFIHCSSETGVPGIDTRPPLESVLTLELTFGSELYDTKDEFLLARPWEMDISSEGDIAIVDEEKIKIFDKFGKGKKIVGGRGQGPGEFDFSPTLFFGPTGYLIALSKSPMGTYYNLYAPDYQFIEKKNTRNKQPLIDILQTKVPGIKRFEVNKIIPLNKSEMVYSVYFFDSQGKTRFISIIHEKDEKITELYHAKDPITFVGGGLISISAFMGYMYWHVIPGRKIMYINTDDDIHDENEGSFYTINVLSIDTGEVKQISKRFTPYIFTDDWEKEYIYRMESRNRQINREMIKFLKEKKYMPSILINS